MAIIAPQFVVRDMSGLVLFARRRDVGFDPETISWYDSIIDAGGTVSDSAKRIADNLIRALKSRSYSSKIVYLLPLLGSGLPSARMPLRDSLGIGIAASTGFLESDFNQAIGLQGDGAGKYFNTHLTNTQLGLANCAGLGWWENNMVYGSNVEPIGNYGNDAFGQQRFTLDLRSSFRSFCWGTSGTNRATSGIAAGNGHYYGQRSNLQVLRLFYNGSQIASNTSTGTENNIGDNNIYVCGIYAGVSGVAPWPGRCACAYLTDGTMEVSEVADFDLLLRSYLFGPTKRPA